MKWQTKFTQAFPCRVPILGAPMAGVSGGLLAAQVSKAGALGFLSTEYFQDVDFVDEQVRIFREATADDDADNVDVPLCLGFIGHAALNSSQGWQNYRMVLEKHRPKVVQFFAPSIMYEDNGSVTTKSNVDLAHEQGAKFMAQVGNLEEARRALDAGVDGLIAQGSGAGGHGLRQGSGTLALASQVERMVRENRATVPVLAAGGIVNGRGVAAALAVCDGAVLGTRLWASQESIGELDLQKELVPPNANCDQVVRTTVFDQIGNRFLKTPWPEPYDSVGCLRNETSDKWDGQSASLAAELEASSSFLEDYKRAQKDCDTNIVKVLAGEGVGEIDSIDPAYDIIERVEQETKDALNRMLKMVSG